MYGTTAVEALGVGKCNHAPCLPMQAEEENLREQALRATCAALRGLSITGRASSGLDHNTKIGSTNNQI